MLSSVLKELSISIRYNDIAIVHDKDLYRRLREGGIDHPLALHVAHLFIRDTVSLFSEKVNQDDNNDTDHFEVSHPSVFNVRSHNSSKQII